jgi:hypothetical protein
MAGATPEFENKEEASTTPEPKKEQGETTIEVVGETQIPVQTIAEEIAMPFVA